MCKRKNLFFLLHIHDEVPKTQSKVRLSFEIHKKNNKYTTEINK